MKKTTLDQESLGLAHQVQLDIAYEVKKICEKYEIKYFMLAGTLLGAIRHNGFIPWDDDLDLGMLRAEYNKFLEVAKIELDSKYFLQTWDTDSGYGQPFAKIRKNGTRYVEENSRNVNCHSGIYIDIFPFDNVPDKRIYKYIHDIKTRFYRRVLLEKCKYSIPKQTGIKKLLYRTAQILSKNSDVCELKRKYYSEMTRYNKAKTEFIVAIGGAYGYKKESLKRLWFDELIEIKFETGTFKAPKDYKEYLRYFYGDYMTPPPVEKRSFRHEIIDVMFEEVK